MLPPLIVPLLFPLNKLLLQFHFSYSTIYPLSSRCNFPWNKVTEKSSAIQWMNISTVQWISQHLVEPFNYYSKSMNNTAPGGHSSATKWTRDGLETILQSHDLCLSPTSRKAMYFLYSDVWNTTSEKYHIIKPTVISEISRQGWRIWVVWVVGSWFLQSFKQNGICH